MRGILPYLIAFLGIFLDWTTTQIGLSRGFYETHLAYTPANASIIFLAALITLEVLLRDFPHKRPYQGIMACLSLLGAVNNTLVLLGVFTGLIL